MGAGIDPEWTQGARAMADIIEDALIGVYDRPIPLDPRGKAAAALMRALSLTGPASWDATSEHAQLLNASREAGTRSPGHVSHPQPQALTSRPGG